MGVASIENPTTDEGARRGESMLLDFSTSRCMAEYELWIRT